MAMGYPDTASGLCAMPTDRRPLREFCLFQGFDTWRHNHLVSFYQYHQLELAVLIVLHSECRVLEREMFDGAKFGDRSTFDFGEPSLIPELFMALGPGEIQAVTILMSDALGPKAGNATVGVVVHVTGVSIF